MSWLFDLIKLVLGLWLSKPDSLAKEAEKAGSAQARLEDRIDLDEHAQKAITSVNDVSRVIDNDDKLRSYEATDPNNRDND